jgi:hypothetical protein
MRSILFMIPLAACAGPLDAAVPVACDGQSREVALDEVVGDGLVANDVIALVTGTFADVAATDEGDVDVTLEAAYDSGSAVACEGIPVDYTGTVSGASQGTMDRLDVPMVLTLSSADGAFDGERANVFVTRSDPASAIAHYSLASSQLNGSFTRPDADQLDLEISWDGDATFGEVSANGESVLAWPSAAFAGGL